MPKKNNDRPAWMPKKWTNRNQVMATAVFKAISDLNKAIVDLDEYEAKIVMAALDQHYVHVLIDEEVPPVDKLSALDSLCDVDLIWGGPRLALHSQHGTEIENDRNVEMAVRNRLKVRR